MAAGNDLAQELETLAGNIGRLKRHTGGVAARPCKACDETGANRVRHTCEHDRND